MKTAGRKKSALDRDHFQACMPTPFAVLGIRTDGDYLTHLEFLPRKHALMNPRTPAAALACQQLEAYLSDSSFRFKLPLSVEGTLHQMAVWRAMQQIPRGETRTYGDMARAIKSAPRAVGQACGKNPVPIIIPCHRVVSSTGLGGFMGAQEGDPIKIKQWLLAHEHG
jgi:methylated-DNA-[protein]-cysteine S-methyltransferase